MKKWGIYLIVLGIGSFLLPMLGLQFRILVLFGEAAPVIGGILLVIGIFMVIGGTVSERKHIQSVAGKSGDAGVFTQGSSTPGTERKLKCYACKADISETDTICPKCRTPL